MIGRFVRFIALFNILLILGVIAFFHYGSSQIDVNNPTSASAWLQFVNWSLDFVLFLFYLLLTALIVIFVVYLRRSRK